MQESKNRAGGAAQVMQHLANKHKPLEFRSPVTPKASEYIQDTEILIQHNGRVIVYERIEKFLKGMGM
jgi:hypothetical protein